MKFIELTLATKEQPKIYVNLSLITDVFVKPESETTTITFSQDYYFSVLETPSEIFKDILFIKTEIEKL